MSCEWKEVPGFDLYLCSTDGFVKNKKRNRLLKPSEDKNGYLRVVLVANKKKKNIAVHRVVGMTFIKNPQNKPQINHIDGNKKNNTVQNLEWVTNEENRAHAFRTGLACFKGEKNPNAKINTRTVKHIRKLFATGKWNKCQLARMFSISRTMVRFIVENKNWGQ